MRFKYLKVCFLLCFSLSGFSYGFAKNPPPGYQITYQLHGVRDTMAWLCEVYGGEVVAIDSCVVKKGMAKFTGDSELPHGVYKIVFNDTLFTDIIYAGEVTELESWLPDIINRMQVHRSEENQILFGYWKYYFRIQDTLDQVIQKGREIYYASQGKPSKELDALEKRSDQLDEQKILYITRLMQQYPNRFAPKLVWSFQKPDYRYYLVHDGQPYPTEEAYYRAHFFDRLDFSDPRMLRTEVLYVMINDYMRTFAPAPSTPLYIELTGDVLARASASNEVYQFCIDLFIKNFEAGVWEKVFIYLIEEHYLRSPLANATLKKVYGKRAQAIRNTSIGEKVPNVCGSTPAGEHHCLLDELGTRTLLVFWSLGCDHCEAILPDLVKIQNEYREKGLKIFAFTMAPDKDSLQASLDHFGINWINVSDYREFLSDVIDQFNISVTPMMFLLDNKGIITDKPGNIPTLYANLVVSYRDN